VGTSRTLTKFWAYLRGSFWTEGPLLWAKLFALSSLIFLILVIPKGNFQEVYRNLLLGFVPFYIIAVQHATIPFPKIKGGLFKISAYLSFPLMLLGYFLNSLAFKLGFLLFLSFQLLPLIYYRIKISKKIYDRISYMFMGLAFLAGVFSLFLDGKAFLHAIFLGFELGMFLGCMAWMLPNCIPFAGFVFHSPIFKPRGFYLGKLSNFEVCPNFRHPLNIDLLAKL
jgi:hypothetical protein